MYVCARACKGIQSVGCVYAARRLAVEEGGPSKQQRQPLSGSSIHAGAHLAASTARRRQGNGDKDIVNSARPNAREGSGKNSFEMHLPFYSRRRFALTSAVASTAAGGNEGGSRAAARALAPLPPPASFSKRASVPDSCDALALPFGIVLAGGAWLLDAFGWSNSEASASPAPNEARPCLLSLPVFAALALAAWLDDDALAAGAPFADADFTGSAFGVFALGVTGIGERDADIRGGAASNSSSKSKASRTWIHHEGDQRINFPRNTSGQRWQPK